MKFSVLAENINKKIASVLHGVSTHPHLPVLSGFYLSAQEDIHISSTDLEIAIKSKIPGGIEQKGETVVPAKPFADLLASIGEGKVIIEEKNGKLSVSAEKTKASFQTMKAEDFPEISEEKGEKELTIDKETAHKLKKVVFAASQDATRASMSGVRIEGASGQVTLVATDGYRLSLDRIKNKKDNPSAASIKAATIPSRAIKEALLSKEEEEKTELYLSKDLNQAIFIKKDTVVVGRVIGEAFPDYEKILPSSSSSTALFEREDLLSAVKTCSVFAREAGNIIKLSLGKEGVDVSARGEALGEGKVFLDAKTTGEENEIAFNARYLIELLTNIEDERMELQMQGPLNPGVFRIEGDSSFLHLIMPIRLQE